MLASWVQSPNQRVAGGDNCVRATNTIKENKPSLTLCCSYRASDRQPSFKTPTKPQGTYFSQTARLSEKKGEDKVEIEIETRVQDLLPAAMLSLAASLWPWWLGPDRGEPTPTPCRSSQSSHTASSACLCQTIIAKSQPRKHKNNCPLPWPQRGVGHLDSSEPSTPQKTTMRAQNETQAPLLPTSSHKWAQLWINTPGFNP